MYQDEVDEDRYIVGCDGAQFMVPFQCDLCIFRSLYKRDPRGGPSDLEALETIRRMNLDLIWSREPGTIDKNMRHLNNVIVTCEASGFEPDLPALGPLPYKDIYGWSVAFTMLLHSTREGRNVKEYTQFGTIRKSRSAFSNLYGVSAAGTMEMEVLSLKTQPAAQISACPTNSFWFIRWVSGCETRMGYVEKKNKPITIEILMRMMRVFDKFIRNSPAGSWTRFRWISGLVYTVLTFAGSFRGSETLKMDWLRLIRYLDNGRTVGKERIGRGRKMRTAASTPHIIIGIRGRFKGEKGERCHLIPMANETGTGIKIRKIVELFVAAREQRRNIKCNWAFVNEEGKKMSFDEMNGIVLDVLETVKEEDVDDALLLKDITIREDFSSNRSFRRGSTGHALNQKIPQAVVEAHNRWRKIERSKGKKPKLGMIEEYSEIAQLVPTRVQYTEML